MVNESYQGETVSDELEVVREGDDLIVTGERSAVDRFFEQAGVLSQTLQVPAPQLRRVLGSAASATQTASQAVEQSGRYLKLTPDSAQKIKDAGGLIPTEKAGISHIMLGKIGASQSWLQAETGRGALMTNPAVLTGVGALLSQSAQRAEAQELRELLVRIDGKLDDVLRAQRNEILARLKGTAAALDRAMTTYEHGGSLRTSWDTVSGAGTEILQVQEKALDDLGAIADKAEGTNFAAVRKMARDLERDAAIYLAVLARCFELADRFAVIELEHVLITDPDRLEGHQAGLKQDREERREAVLDRTRSILERLDAAAEVASDNVLLHARAAQAMVASLNNTAALVDDLHAPLGITLDRKDLELTTRRAALQDRHKVKVAGVEMAKKVGAAGATAAAVASTLALGREVLTKDP